MPEEIDNYFQLGKMFLDKGFTLKWHGSSSPLIDSQHELRDLIHEHPDEGFFPLIGYEVRRIAIILPDDHLNIVPDTLSVSAEENHRVLFFALPPGVKDLQLPECAGNLVENPGSFQRRSRQIWDRFVKELPVKFIKFKDNVDNVLDPGNATFTKVNDKWQKEFSNLSAQHQKILLVLMRETIGRYDQDKERRKEDVQISYSRLADKTGSSKSTIQRSVSEMKSSGWIETEGEEGRKLRFKVR